MNRPAFVLGLLTVGAIFSCAGCSAPETTETTMRSPLEGDPALVAYCCMGPDQWHRVLAFDANHLVTLADAMTFEQVWEAPLTPSPVIEAETVERSWSECLLPLPDPHVKTIGYALTFISHQEEVHLDNTLSFSKFGRLLKISNPMRYRPYLDFEAEVAVLMERGQTDRFGYLMFNDLTDRGIQVRYFDKNDSAPGFTMAKSFYGANRVGPLLVMGNAAAWETLEVKLSFNGEPRQHVLTRECIIDPTIMHRELFAVYPRERWLLAGSGTSGGVLFDTPDFWEKFEALLAGHLSRRRAEKEWLSSLRFMEVGDQLILSSPQLGYSVSEVVDEIEEESW